MKIEVEVPDWTKAVTVSYVYFADGGEGRITMGVKPDLNGLKRHMRFAGFWRYDEWSTVVGEFGSGPVPGVWVTILEGRHGHS